MTPTAQRARVAGAAILAALVAVTPLFSHASASNTVEIQILNVSDWHAQLDPSRGVGGAAYLSTYFQQERAVNPNTLTVTAGDAFGASPPLSGFFDEVPGVKAMNLMGFDVDTLGNHNFDKGVAHLQQMIDFAEFPFVSANLKNVDANLVGVEPYALFDFEGVGVAVIGVTNPEAPTLVFPGNFGTIEVTDPVTAAHDARAEAEAAGADVFVLIAHMGVTGRDETTGLHFGPLVDLANGVTGFDLILGDHTDVQYHSVINGALVTENRSKGVTYSRVTLTVDAATGDVIARDVQFVTPTTSGVTPDPAIVETLAPYREALAAAYDEPIGEAADEFPRGGNIERLGEVAVGNLVADAMRERYGADVAFTNGGGIRTALPSTYAPKDLTLRRNAPGYAAGPPYDLVVGDVYGMLPFGNSIVTRNVTGAQLHAIMEHALGALPGASGRFAQISGFSVLFDATRPAGERVVAMFLDARGPDGEDLYQEVTVECPALAPVDLCSEDVVVKGRPGTPILRDNSTLVLATNDFVNAGGDGYAMLADGEGVTRDVMADVILQHIKKEGTVTPRTENRLVDLAPTHAALAAAP